MTKAERIDSAAERVEAALAAYDAADTAYLNSDDPRGLLKAARADADEDLRDALLAHYALTRSEAA